MRSLRCDFECETVSTVTIYSNLYCGVVYFCSCDEANERLHSEVLRTPTATVSVLKCILVPEIIQPEVMLTVVILNL